MFGFKNKSFNDFLIFLILFFTFLIFSFLIGYESGIYNDYFGKTGTMVIIVDIISTLFLSCIITLIFFNYNNNFIITFINVLICMLIGKLVYWKIQNN
jgi:hypothetical protein